MSILHVHPLARAKKLAAKATKPHSQGVVHVQNSPHLGASKANNPYTIHAAQLSDAKRAVASGQAMRYGFVKPKPIGKKEHLRRMGVTR